MRTFILSVLCAVAFQATAAVAGDLVVVESRGTELRPGQTLDGTKTLVLRDGQQVVLISASGKTLKLRGPWDQPPESGDAGSAADVAGALKSLVAAKMARTDRVGVVRGAGDEVVPPEPWLVDVTHVGNRCVLGEEQVMFWRPVADRGAKITIAPSDRSWQARADWPAGMDRMLVPKTVPLQNRVSYIVSLDGKEAAITLITVPSALSNDAMRVGWMTEAGCAAQAQALLQQAR
jgi:hypothetical protein